MNARVLRVSVVTLATLLALTSFAFAQTLSITSPLNNSHVDLTYEDSVAGETGDVTLQFNFTTPPGVVGRILVYVDDEPVLTQNPAAASYLLEDLAAGSHVVTAYLTDDAGQAYDTPTSVSVVRFYLSRVCASNTDCVDADPCSNGNCIGRSDVAPWYGRCRFGPNTADSDCCVTSEWCRHAGLTHGDPTDPEQYKCTDVDADGTNDCVQCVENADCVIFSACQASAACVDNACVYTPVGGDCCEVDSQAADCYDANDCTADVCDPNTNRCSNNVIAGCCLQGRDDLSTGAPDYGCTPDGADPCTMYSCIGSGATAACREGPLYGQCCAEDTDCTDPTQLNICTDHDGRGYGTCAGIGADPAYPGVGTCTYPKIDPECCIKHYECAGRYPEEIGSCNVIGGQEWKICQYEENLDFCVADVQTLVINEFMPNPGGPAGNKVPDLYGEWFEIFNPSPQDVNINGWVVEDARAGDAQQSFTIDNGGYLVVPAGGYTLLGREDNPLSNGWVLGIDYEYPETWDMHNEADEIILKDASGAVVDDVRYVAADWPITESYSVSLIHPYLDNSQPGNWNPSRLGYKYDIDGVPTPRNYGTPGEANVDVFDTTLIAATISTCNDNNPCTIDICNLDKASICSHRKLTECCTADTARTACNDLNACTTDSCNTAENLCVHESAGDCCVSDVDCEDWYPAEIDSAGAEVAFDLCATKTCIANVCRYGRNLDRPNCCVEGSTSFGCFDRNICTVDVCEPAGGVDATGIEFDQCKFDLDLDTDGINDCCRTPSDCDDGEPQTIDACQMNPAILDPPVNRCWYKEDPSYCGVGSTNPGCDDGDACTIDTCCTGEGVPEASCPADGRCVHIRVPDCCVSAQNCVDGLACTTDACCTGPGEPLAECTGANQCAHHEAAAGCCETQADCNGANKPADMYCRTGYCIGAICRYGPPIDGCCVEAADCDPTTCTGYQCVANTCQAEPVAGCCMTGEDCPAHEDPCMANVCMDNVCTAITVPNCCVDTNPTGPDAGCQEAPTDNPCTADYCMLQPSGNYICRHFPVGGAGCCVSAEMCPEDNVQCTTLACTDDSCALNPVSNCLAISSYKMTFTEGNSVYAGEYASVGDLSWGTDELGTNAAAQFFGFGTSGALGPDQHLKFAPTTAVADFESCVLLPSFRTDGMTFATLAFDWAADWTSGTATFRTLVRNGGGWLTATEMWTTAIDADVAATSVNIPFPQTALNTGGQGVEPQVALCVSGASTDALTELMIDQVVMAQGHAPALAEPANLSASVGQTKTITGAFSVNEQDVDENVTIELLNAPGAWVKVTNTSGNATGQWTADLQINGAVCPSTGSSYTIQVKASDGALFEVKDFVLVIDGCTPAP